MKNKFFSHYKVSELSIMLLTFFDNWILKRFQNSDKSDNTTFNTNNIIVKVWLG